MRKAGRTARFVFSLFLRVRSRVHARHVQVKPFFVAIFQQRRGAEDLVQRRGKDGGTPILDIAGGDQNIVRKDTGWTGRGPLRFSGRNRRIRARGGCRAVNNESQVSETLPKLVQWNIVRTVLSCVTPGTR